MASGTPSFSYAQAAKGEVSQPPSATPSKANSSTDQNESTHVEARLVNSTDLGRDSTNQDGEPFTEPEAKASVPSGPVKPVVPQAFIKTETTPLSEAEPLENAASTPISATANSSATIGASDKPAQDDTGYLASQQSDATSDQSQQKEMKAASKGESDNDDSKSSSCEQAPPAIQLKEAPLPTFNIWHKRAADAKTKTHDPKVAAPAGSPFHAEASTASSQRKATDSQADVSVKRKSTPVRQNTGDRSPAPSPREQSHSSNATQSAPLKSVIAPPPPNDAMSWPTPEHAKEEERRKPGGKADKAEKVDGDKTPSKPHGKEKWVQMPYVPTAVFNTPLPTNRRGGRTARGGREGSGRGNASNGVNGNDKPNTGGGPPMSSTTSFATGRGDSGPGSQTSKSKRASSAGPSTSTEGRRPGDENGLKSNSTNRQGLQDGRRISSGQQSASRRWSPGSRPHGSEVDYRSQPLSQDTSHSRNVSERRNDILKAGGDSNGYGPSRERGDGRPERGRGSYRGRGNFANPSNSHHGPNAPFSATSGTMPSYGSANSQNYSDPRRESLPAGTPFSNSRESRHGRNTSRSQSIPGSNFGRYPNGPQHLPQLHIDAANMFYTHPPGIMSAVPYPGYVDQGHLSGVLQSQMEYYFSVDNLCKDMFLRKQMDSQGFVFLDVLQNFNRIKSLTIDGELVRFVCLRSSVIEFITGGDGIDRVRRREDWQQWVMPKDERDLTARNDGPSQFNVPQHPFMIPYGDSKMNSTSGGPMTPRTAHPGAHFRPESLMFSETYHQGSPVAATPPASASIVDTPLSAAVPDFQPTMSIAPGTQYPVETRNATSEVGAAELGPTYPPAKDALVGRKAADTGNAGVPNGLVKDDVAIHTTSLPANSEETANGTLPDRTLIEK